MRGAASLPPSGGGRCISEADSDRVAAADSTSHKNRGRPPLFTEQALRQAAGYSYARRVATRRGEQDLVYRMFAVAAIEHYREAFPESAPALDWLLEPRLRHSLLSELGRLGKPSSGQDGQLRWSAEDVSCLIEAALEIAELRPTTKEGVAMLRARRRSSRGGFGNALGRR